MDYLFFFLFFISLISFLALIIGLIKPSLVIRWRNNKNRKKVLIYYGFSMIIFLILSGVISPGLKVEDHIENAREHMKKNEYKRAISDYQDAFENWEKGNNYSFTRDQIENEFKNASKKHSSNLINQAQTAFEDENLDKAENKINEAIEYWPSHNRITELKTKITKAMKKKEADKYLDQAEEYIEENKIEKASEEITKASELINDYSRITILKNKNKAKLQSLANDKLYKAEKELDNWNLDQAEKYITSVEDLLSNNSRIQDLKDKLSERKNIIDEIGAKPENSEWDAAVKPVTDYLKTHLKDPDSVEYIEWSPVHLCHVEGQPYWRVRTKYRAKNSFGGYVIEEKLFYMAHKQVVAVENY